MIRFLAAGVKRAKVGFFFMIVFFTVLTIVGWTRATKNQKQTN